MYNSQRSKQSTKEVQLVDCVYVIYDINFLRGIKEDIDKE